MTDGRRVIADEAYLTRSMMEPTADVVTGFKPVMPSFFGILDPAGGRGAGGVHQVDSGRAAAE